MVGPRVTVRPVAEADRAPMFAAANDPKLWAQHPDPLRYTEQGFNAYFDGALASGTAYAFCENVSGRVIGSSRYHGHDAEKREVEIGWTFLAREFWGGSYNREVKSLMLQHAFQFVDTVVFWVGEDNTRSRRAMEKIGGVLRPGTVQRDAAGDALHVVYEIKARNWRARG
ncbi:MAG: GNAT family N-acetyltransferase [Pseudomonadota bacterium]